MTQQMSTRNTLIRHLVLENGSIWVLYIARSSWMITFTLDSYLYGSLHGSVRSALFTMNEVLQIMGKVTAYYHFIDYTMLHKVVHWVRECGQEAVDDQ
jgi:hypothetical protein